MEFPEGFFEKEVRCGFEVPSMMKRAWAAQMEILKVVADICERHGIQYYADSGTLLGAVRHKGFIPWDDDVDIALKRSDYNKLIRLLPKELPYGFVMTGLYADTERLRNIINIPQITVMADETQWKYEDYMRFFHGFPFQRCSIEIFPLDAMPDDEDTARLVGGIIKWIIYIQNSWKELAESGQLNDNIRKIADYCNVDIPWECGDLKNWLWRLMDTLCYTYEDVEGTTQNLTMWYFYDETKKLIAFDRTWYDEVIYMPFEQIKIAVPSGYDNILRVWYGDYMTPVKDGSFHNYPFYGAKMDELKRQLCDKGFTGTVDEFCEYMSGEK